MKSFIKRAGALMAAAALVVASGLFSMQVKAATTRPEVTSVSVSTDSANAGDTVTVTVIYTGSAASSIQLNFTNPYSALDYNLYSYGYTGSYGAGIGSFSAVASAPGSVYGDGYKATATVTIPSSSYGSYTISAKVVNSSGSGTGSGSLFVSNTSLDTAKPSLLTASVGTKNNGNKKYIEVVATATDAYHRNGQTSSQIAGVSVAFENVEKPGTWTKTISLLPYNDVYYGQIDISSIETPGTYVLNYAQVVDTSGNQAIYKKTGTTLTSSSYDTRFFPRNLDKVTFTVGEAAGKTSVDNKNETTATQQATNAPSSNGDVSPKTSENGVVIPVLIMLAVVLLGSVSIVTVIAKKVN